MAYNEGIYDLKINPWAPENAIGGFKGRQGQIDYWREQYTKGGQWEELAEFNEYVRREGLEEVTTKTEYRTLDTTDKREIRVGDRVTFSRNTNPEMGEITGVAYTTGGSGKTVMVADFLAKSEYNTIHKIERPVIAMPTEPGLYTIAPVGSPPGDYRVYGLSSRGVWSEGGVEALYEDHYMFEYVADGDWTLRRLVVEGE